MSDELQNYKIQEAISQGKLNESTIGAHGLRIGKLENDCNNMQRTVNMTEENQRSISKCEKRLDEYDSWRRALLWTAGKLYLLTLAIGGILGFILTMIYVKR